MTEESIAPTRALSGWRARRRVVLVSLHGEHDMATAAGLDETPRKLIESNASNLVVDLNECSFIDATTIQVLLKGAR